MTQAFLRWGSLLALLIIWQLTIGWFSPQDLPSPLTVLQSLLWHTTQGTLLDDLWITVTRVLLSFTMAMVLGCIIGIMMGANRTFNLIGDGALLILLNVPALVTIILAYIWFGLVESAAILAVVINKFPVVVITMREGARNIDNDLIDVARVFALPKHRLFFKVYLPQLYPYIMTSARNGLSLIWKIVLVVELLGRSDGIGFALHSFFQFFDIASILAYTFAFVIVIFVIEALAFRPLDKVVARGR